jgi:hypothetical protein
MQKRRKYSTEEDIGMKSVHSVFRKGIKLTAAGVNSALDAIRDASKKKTDSDDTDAGMKDVRLFISWKKEMRRR